jgi:hypothetical protein
MGKIRWRAYCAAGEIRRYLATRTPQPYPDLYIDGGACGGPEMTSCASARRERAKPGKGPSWWVSLFGCQGGNQPTRAYQAGDNLGELAE